MLVFFIEEKKLLPFQTNLKNRWCSVVGVLFYTLMKE
jgi:hypothetical protein